MLPVVDGQGFRDLTGFDEAELSRLVDFLGGTDVVELQVRRGKRRLWLRRDGGVASRSVAPQPGPAEAEPEELPLAITSPLVGLFHPAVEPGELVVPGQTLGAVEAMGLPTRVDAPQGGVVEELLVHDGERVEWGQPLLVLRRLEQGPGV